MYKISIIIPVYNSKYTLQTAVNSVINQTFGFENIELILVDDNSNDDSKLIIQDFSNQYDNIKAIFLDENTGSPSIPRNIGIENSTAPYLMFLDNDDEFVSDYCETVYEIISHENVDIVNTSYCRKFISKYYAFNDSEKYYEDVKDALSLRFTVWGNIFRKDFIKQNNITFPDSLYEDGVFCIKAFTKANRIIQLPKYIGYIYTVERENDNSITHNTKKENIVNFIKGFIYSNEYLANNNFDKQRLVDDIPMIYFMFFKFKGSKKDKLDLLKQIRHFEKSLNYSITLKSKPLDILNKFVLCEKYSFSIILSSIASKFYNNNKIKNFIFKNYSNLKKIDL